MDVQPQEVFAAKAKHPWRPRFRLASLLWLTLCVAIGITAYQAGVEATRRELWRNRTGIAAPYVAVYYVGDLAEVANTATGVSVSFDPLIKDIEGNVFPRTWTASGGEASISAFVTNLSLVVAHDKEGHEEIARYLALKRKAAPAGRSPYELPSLEQASSVK